MAAAWRRCDGRLRLSRSARYRASNCVAGERSHAPDFACSPGAAQASVCWQDRHYQYPRKDAHDLNLIIRNYLIAGNEERLWNTFSAWTEEDDFDFERAGARMLGYDMRLLLDDVGIGKVSAILSEQSNHETSGLLPSEMSAHEPERARV